MLAHRTAERPDDRDIYYAPFETPEQSSDLG
jgi:hypothetical protein